MARGVLVPVRFLAMLAHMLAMAVFALSRKDNVIVSLKFDYTSSEFERADSQMVAVVFMMLICFFVLSIGFFGGFTMFSPGLGLLHTVLHITGGILLSVMIMEKWHYVAAWYIFGFCSALPTCIEGGALYEVIVMKKSRW